MQIEIWKGPKTDMKKKDVMIEISGLYTQDNDTDSVDLVTDGTYAKDHEKYIISYEESEVTGMAGCRIKMTVDGEQSVAIARSAPAESELVVERGVRHVCHYNTGMGFMSIGISGSRISSTLDDCGGKLEFSYSLDINTALASENTVTVTVREIPAPEAI